MTAALNFVPAAIEHFDSHALAGAPMSRAGFAYLADKLRRAEVYVLPHNGELIDRALLRPEIPVEMLRPPAPVVALEYISPPNGRSTPGYTDSRSSRRIALAWDWQDDLPKPLARFREGAPPLGPGLGIASICFADNGRSWITISAGMHVSYGADWEERTGGLSPFAQAAIVSGQITMEQATQRSFRMSLVPFLPEALFAMGAAIGPAALMDSLQADMMDEVNAYFDFAVTLGCRAPEIEEHPAPERLNKGRAAAGRPPLKGFRTLRLRPLQ